MGNGKTANIAKPRATLGNLANQDCQTVQPWTRPIHIVMLVAGRQRPGRSP